MNKLRLVVMMFAAIIFPIGIAAQPASTPEAGNQQTSISGDAWLLVPEGEPGKVSIVAFTGPDSDLGEVSVLIRNNSNDTISNIGVKSEFRDGSGKLIGVGDVSVFEPNIVEPGGIAFGLTMGGMVSDPSIDVDLKLSYDKGEGMVIGKNLEFVYSEWTGDRIIGEFINPTSAPMSVIHLSYACFTADGEFMGVKWGSANGDLLPGETTTFQVADSDRDTSMCEHHLVTGNGF